MATFHCREVRKTMNKNLWLIIGIAFLVVFQSSAAIAAKKTTRDRQSTRRRTENKTKDNGLQQDRKAQQGFEQVRQAGKAIELPDKVESLTDDMVQLDERVGLTEKQKTKIGQMRTARDNSLAAWDKTNRTRFDTLKARLDKLSPDKHLKDCKRIVALLRTMQKKRASIATIHERKFFAVLTAEQRAKWNAPILFDILREEFSSLELTDEQTGQIKAVSDTHAKRCRFALAANVSPQITQPMRRHVYSRILTAKQRKEYAATKKPKKTGDKSR